MKLERYSRPTLCAVEMDVGDSLVYKLSNGTTRILELMEVRASLHRTSLKELKVEERGGVTVVGFRAIFKVDGIRCEFARIIGSQASFYEPPVVFGFRIWIDACQDVFEFIAENHGSCKPRKRLRFAIQEATRSVAPVLLHPWCPLPRNGIRIEDCYDGHDCWLGPYRGASAHGGLDLNHPAGTPLWTPVGIDTQRFVRRIEAGDGNNRWTGTRRWPDGSTWMLTSAHVIELTVLEDTPLDGGFLYARSGGVNVGSNEHTHFMFGVVEPDETDEILLDPYILFRQMYLDRRTTLAEEALIAVSHF